MIDAPRIGVLEPGARDSIADVAGVTVGHLTLADGAELGTLESPIALTNTFAVGTIATAMIRHAVSGNPGIGRTSPTLNALVTECNDGWLNDLQAFAVGDAHYAHAFDAASADFAQGAVGAGRGMSCFELKGGITAVEAFVTGLECFSLAESLGGVESLIAHPASMTHAAMDAAARCTAGISDALLRVSVGIEALQDLQQDVTRALERVAKLTAREGSARLARTAC